MIDETAKLKTDIQHAIANEITEYSTAYGTLIFDENTFPNIESLRYFESLKIYVKDNKMNFDIKLDKDEINGLTESDIKQIKSISNRIRCLEMAEQINNHLKSDEQKGIENQNAQDYIANMLEDEEEDKTEFIPVRKNNIEKMRAIKLILNNIFNLSVEIEEQDLFLSISTVFKELTLNQEMLYILILISLYTDIIVIHPYYEDNEDLENENIIGVRLFLGIYKGGGF